METTGNITAKGYGNYWDIACCSDKTYNHGSDRRNNFDDISQSTSGKPDDKSDYTVMVYMIGSDLESDAACATEDINEMIESGIGDNVTVVLQTGGTKEWHNNKVTGGETQRLSSGIKK